MKKLFNFKLSESKFYILMTGLTAGLIFIGFANTYIRKLFVSESQIPSIIHLHAIVFFFWLILFVLQVLLVRLHRFELHRQLGKYSIFLIFSMLVVGLLASIDAARTGHLGIPGVMFTNWHSFLFLNLAALFIFIILSLSGILMNNRSSWHKRLMLMATLGGLGPPGFSRLPFISGHEAAIALVTGLLIFSAPLIDYKINKKLHPAYFISTPLIFLILPPVVNLIGTSKGWIQIAEFIIKL